MHVVTTRRHYTAKDGTERVYEAQLLRRPADAVPLSVQIWVAAPG